MSLNHPLSRRPFPALACFLLCGLSGISTAFCAAPDQVFADFEAPGYGAWEATGEAFGSAPAPGTLPGQMPVTGFAGTQLVNSFRGGDRSTGKLLSPEFEISRDYIAFLIGGGGHEGETCMNLLVDGERVQTATGPNVEPGGSEALAPGAWDVRAFRGKKARIEVVDSATGGWGHINVDQIVFTDTKPAGALQWNVSREWKLTAPSLSFPVKAKAPKRRVTILVAGEPVRDFEIELADGEPDYWMPADLRAFVGKTVTVRVASLPGESRALEAIRQTEADDLGSGMLYAEALRPQFHFSSRRGWLNDPNGLVYHAGEYHLYYQHNPYGAEWGNMHWGHAVSRDLVHWEELPIALYPKRFGDWAYSGSAVVDRQNTSGFRTGDEPVLVAAYTSTGRGECILYSNDRGRTWEEYAGNPVVKHQGRDPRLLWHEETGRWVMALYSEEEGKQWITFHTSPNLKQWTYESRIEGFYECPDLVELSVEGEKHWVLYGANGDYLIGKFDGRTFTPVTGMIPGPPGGAFYAAQTFSNLPPEDGRCIQIGWGRVPSPGMSFNQMMTFPCTLSLRRTENGLRLAWQPVREIEHLHGERKVVKDQPLEAGRNALEGLGGELLHVKLEVALGEAERIALDVRGTPIVYDRAKGELSCGNVRTKIAARDTLSLQLLVDRTSLEIFAEDGVCYLVAPAIPKPEHRSLELTARGNGARLISAEVIQLKSAWPR